MAAAARVLARHRPAAAPTASSLVAAAHTLMQAATQVLPAQGLGGGRVKVRVVVAVVPYFLS